MELAEMDIEPNRVTSETIQRIKQETAIDPVLASLCNEVTSGWPAKRKETRNEGSIGVSKKKFLFTME